MGDVDFGYVVSVEESNCGNAKVLDWIELGSSASGLSIPVGEFSSRKVIFNIPTGAPLCSVRYNVKVTYDNSKSYADDYFDIVVKAK